MAGKNRYDLAKKILEKFKGQSYFVEDLKGIIRKYLSGNEKTILDYLFLMRETGLIKEILVKSGITKWEILPKCQEQIIKEEQTKNAE